MVYVQILVDEQKELMRDLLFLSTNMVAMMSDIRIVNLQKFKSSKKHMSPLTFMITDENFPF